MFSLLTRRLGYRLPTLINRTVLPIVVNGSTSAVTRRTFLTTARLQAPATVAKSKATTKAKATTRAKAAPKKPAAKKPAAKAKRAVAKTPTRAKAAPKKRGRPLTKPKPKAVPKVPKSGLPPTRPVNAYILFHTKFVNGQKENAKSLEDVQALSRNAGAVWRSYSAEEKQPFIDEQEALKAEYLKKQAEYWENATPGLISAINKRRKHEGKVKIHRPRQSQSSNRKPLTSFLRFVQEFRQSPDAAAIRSIGSGNRADCATARIAAEAGKRWRALSDADKAPYVQAFEEDQREWRRNQSAKESA
ncbi:hypothetical protein BV22DRAFT_1194237 [Leucogyrophana mollusca]|uniref:Uncharacterized protein n=1 Tax=Leucogyrophana mollusca TaxID=85980 RepID=A0ACB8BKY5_9AGAM|nr:hypothetical protein BV22DRAFT_1194237 [Leucogyrophana mollusca]